VTQTGPPLEPGPSWSDIASWYNDLLLAGSGPHQTAAACLIGLASPAGNERVLDLACGQGFASRALLAAGAGQVVGVDSSPNMIGHAIDMAPRATPVMAERADTDQQVPAIQVHTYLTEQFWRSPNPEGVRRAGAHHRTISTYVNELLAAGFSIERMEEPRANEVLRERSPVYGEIPIDLAHLGVDHLEVAMANSAMLLFRRTVTAVHGFPVNGGKSPCGLVPPLR